MRFNVVLMEPICPNSDDKVRNLCGQTVVILRQGCPRPTQLRSSLSDTQYSLRPCLDPMGGGAGYVEISRRRDFLLIYHSCRSRSSRSGIRSPWTQTMQVRRASSLSETACCRVICASLQIRHGRFSNMPSMRSTTSEQAD